MTSNQTPRPSEELEPLIEAGRLAAAGSLARDCAHEVNNPLFAILVLAEFVRRELEPGSKAHERMLLLEQSANDIKAVVGRMHRFARDRAAEPVEVALADAAAEAVDLLRHVSATRGVTVTERYADGPAAVRGDPSRLTLLFVHVLLNAFQALPGGGRVTVEVERGGGEVVATVADTGPGFPDGSAGDAFEPYVTTKESAGLGLAVARAIAELYGGTLSVDPPAGPGARLVLRLPEAG